MVNRFKLGTIELSVPMTDDIAYLDSSISDQLDELGADQGWDYISDIEYVSSRKAGDKLYWVKVVVYGDWIEYTNYN